MVKDFKSGGYVSDNIIDLLKNDEKIKIFKLLNCDEKYTDSRASDFEFFDEWERILPLASGHREVKMYDKELSLVGLSPVCGCDYSRERSIERWRRANREAYIGTFEEGRDGSFTPTQTFTAKKRPHPTVYDIVKNVSDITINCRDYDELSGTLIAEAKKLKNAEIMLTVAADRGEYIRPDPYLARVAYKKQKIGEFYNSSDALLLYSQLSIELILALKKSASLSLRFEVGDAFAACELVRYLYRRHLFEGAVEILTDSADGISTIAELACEVYPKIRVSPVLDCASAALCEAEYLKIFSEYPIGVCLFECGGECGALLRAIDSIADSREHAELLRELTLL